jgi:hypothetical protein
MKITTNEKDWNSETLILDFLQDMQHMMLFYRLNPSELEGHVDTALEGMLIDRFGELVEQLGYKREELYT